MKRSFVRPLNEIMLYRNLPRCWWRNCFLLYFFIFFIFLFFVFC
jgi:hypothetical protein